MLTSYICIPQEIKLMFYMCILHMLPTPSIYKYIKSHTERDRITPIYESPSPETVGRRGTEVPVMSGSRP